MMLETLKGLRAMWREVDSKRERILRLRSDIERITQQLQQTPGAPSPSGDQLAEQVALLVDLESELAGSLVTAEQETQYVESWISDLPDPRQRDVMRLRYVQGLSWRQVAKRLNYSDRQPFNIQQDIFHGE